MTKDMATPSQKAIHGKLIFIMRFWLSLMVLFVSISSIKNGLVDARTVAVSGSFRFPTETDYSDNVNNFIAPPVFANRRIDSEPRFASRDQPIPDSPQTSSTVLSSVSLSNGVSGKNRMEHLSSDESSEVIVIESDSEETENEKMEVTHHDDDGLRDVLCPFDGNDLRGNETSTMELSAGASLPAAEQKLRYDLRVGKCGEVGTRAHCGDNMIFVGEIDSGAYGYCECDFRNKIHPADPESFSKTPLVFHPETNACHRLYEQAYCKKGEWLVLNREEKRAVCEQRKCTSNNVTIKPTSRSGKSGSGRRSKLLTPELWIDGGVASSRENKARNTTSLHSESSVVGEDKNSLWVPLNGTGPCVQLNKAAPEHCEKDEVVVLHVGDVVPKCGFPESKRGIEGRAIVRNACPPGSFYSIIGRCQPDWDF